MQVLESHDDVPAALRGAVLAIGNFDGVHRGHAALLARAQADAATCGVQAGALTFDPHPAAVVAPTSAPRLLTPMPRRLELLAEAGLALTVVDRFDQVMAARSAEEFVTDVLVAGLAVRGVVVGWDFSYGRGRTGTTTTLVAAGASAGFTVAVVPPLLDGDEPVSSSRIRGCLAAGDVAAAARLLGRAWDVDGVVVHGAQRGRELGVPTANVATDGPVPLATGIYAVWLHAGGARRAAVASLGTNPTFVAGGPVVLEVHVLDWSGDLYDQRVRVELAHRLRDEARYDSGAALMAQIHLDLAEARARLA